ncbi:MAG: thermonuclease family protein [Candidatus Aenigmatarchaeota archaeon]
MRKRTMLLAFIIIMAMAYLINSFFANPSIQEETYVTKVVDGDTIVIAGGQRVRLLSIDTREKGENCYDEAKTRLEELILLKNITIEADQEDKDQYDRLLRYVYLDGANINMEMVAEGLAVVYIYEPNVKYRQQFAEYERQARADGTGCVWTTKP